MICSRELDESFLDRFVFESYALQWCLDSQMQSLQERLVEASYTTAKMPPVKRVQQDPSQDIKSSNLVQNPIQNQGVGLSVRDNSHERQNRGEIGASKASPATSANRSQPRESLFARIKEQASGDRSNSVMDMLGPTTIMSSMTDDSLKDPKEEFRPKIEAAPVNETEQKVVADGPVTGVPSRLNLPVSWSEMIENWKKHKPIRARIFEDSFSKEFSPAKIHIMVIRGSSAAQQIFNPQVYAQIKKEFEQLYGFAGELLFSPVDSDDRNIISVTTGEREDEKTLLEKRDEAKLDQVEKTKNEILNHPMTRLFVDKLGGTIGSVTVGED
jgi:hypothetical protein